MIRQMRPSPDEAIAPPQPHLAGPAQVTPC